MDNTTDTMPGEFVAWLPSPVLSGAALTMGMLGMRVGGERQIHVPPHLGKGKRPVDGIGPNEFFFLCE